MKTIPLGWRARTRVLVPVAVSMTFTLAAAVSPASAATLPTGFTETLVASGLSNPTAMAIAPDGRLFVCQQGGQLRVIKNGTLLATPFLTVTVDASGERGLLGVTFDPNFATNQFVYVYYTATTPAIHNRVSRFTANGDVAVPGSETILLDLNNLSSATNHNGGALHFGPDGKLYVAVGENATASNAQTLANLLGKILRINTDGTIPTDNPFFNQATGVNRAIWALGLRNPFTFAFQPGTGRMFINDVGQNAWEEINEGIAGSNYGWPDSEGATTNPAHRGPLFFYGHGSTGTTGCAITGGAFYDPETPQFPPEYEGKYFYADFCSGWIRRLDPPAFTTTGFATGVSSPVDLRVTRDGSLYYLARGSGSVFRVDYTADQAPRITTHPSGRTVPVGGSATFSVAASGAAPLHYRWQRAGVDIPGATGASYTLANASLADDGATFGAVVSNSFGSATSNTATLDVTSNNPPTAGITSPPNNTFYAAGDTVNYAGTGTDPERACCRPAPSPGRWTSTTTPTRIPSCPPRAAPGAARSSSPPPARRRPTCGIASTSRSGMRAGSPARRLPTWCRGSPRSPWPPAPVGCSSHWTASPSWRRSRCRVSSGFSARWAPRHRRHWAPRRTSSRPGRTAAPPPTRSPRPPTTPPTRRASA